MWSHSHTMKIFSLLCTIIGLGLARIEFGNKEVKPAIFDRFDGSCQGQAPIRCDLNGAYTQGSKIWLNTTIISSEDINGEVKAATVLERCKSKESLDTCEPLNNIKFGRYCTAVNMPVWNSFTESFTPAWKCPIRKGIYRGINSSFDLAAAMLFAVENWFWRNRLELRQKRNNRLLACLFIDAYVIRR